jgi:hypothetical protein
MVVFVHQDIGGFDISVADVQAVDVGQPTEQLVSVHFGFNVTQRFLVLGHELVEVVLVVLHHHIEILFVLLLAFFHCMERE